MNHLWLFNFSSKVLEVIQQAEAELSEKNGLCVTSLHVLYAFAKMEESRYGAFLRRAKITADVILYQIAIERFAEPLDLRLISLVSKPISTPLHAVMSRIADTPAIKSGGLVSEATLFAVLITTDCAARKLLRASNFDFSPIAATLRPYFDSARAFDSNSEDSPKAVFDRAGNKLPFSRKLRNAFQNANDAAIAHGVRWYGPAYTLLGIAMTPGTLSSAVLSDHGLSGGNMNSVIAELTPKEMTESDLSVEFAEMTPELKNVIAIATEIAVAKDATMLESEHIMIAMLKTDTKARYVLDQMHVDIDEIVADLERAFER